MNLIRDLRRDHAWVLVLPDPDDPPPSVRKGSIDLSISGNVALELGLPVSDVGLWLGAMDRTPMPKAAIDEHGDLLSRKDDVRPHRPLR
jgi:hypothetical protein